MPLALILTEPTAAPDQFSVVEDGRKVGRIRKTKNQWIWDVDWFGVGRKVVSEHRATGSLETFDDLYRRYWEWVAVSGIEKYGTGSAPTRDKAIASFKAAWASVTKLGADETEAQNSEPVCNKSPEVVRGLSSGARSAAP
jgi:hypothetical protein